MVLNAKGLDVLDRWDDIWAKAVALDVEKRGEDKAEYGTSVIGDYGFIKNADDMIGEMIVTYQEGAIWHIFECLSKTFTIDDEWAFGISCRDFVHMLFPFFSISEREKIGILRRMNELNPHHSKVKVRIHK